MEEELQAIPVQEIATTCLGMGRIPNQFVHKKGYPQPKRDSVPFMDDQIIDFSLLSASELELAKLQSALTQWGCFQAINHGLTSTFLDKVRGIAKQFFALPLEEKQKYARSLNELDGYGNDTIFSKDQTLDWVDRIYLRVYPVDERKLKYWPEKPVEFRGVTHEYTMKLREMFEFLIKAIARCLKLEENCFSDVCVDSVRMDARFNLYPPCSDPENTLGIKPHSDGVIITILMQSEVEGLQVLKDDHWFGVPIIPDALFINVGDQLEIMSNGILKSPVHRVVTNTERERISVAVFCSPDPEKEIGPVNEVNTDERPQAYKKVKQYMSVWFQKYQKEQRLLQDFKL